MKPYHYILAVLALLFGTAIYAGTRHQDPNRPVQPTQPTQANSQCQSAGGLPDSSCTPGVVRTTDLNIICHQGTKQFRPPVSYTDNLKVQQIKQYGYTDTNTADYEEDHLIPLELGGEGKDPKNLWPESRTGELNSLMKDHVENYLHAQVCSGKISIQDAQSEIAANWVKVYFSISNINAY